VDIADLESFLALSHQGSFTLAARERGLTQPGLSRQIQRLERSIGARLFERAPDGVALTPAGERFQSYAEAAVAAYWGVLEELHRQPAPLEGELRLAASTTPAEFMVPQIIADFTSAYPSVQATVYTANTQRVVDEVAAGRRDLGLVGARIRQAGVRFDPVARDEVVLAVPARHPFASQEEIPLAALADQPFIDRENGSGTILTVRRALADRGLDLPPLRIVMTLSTTQAIVSAVRAGFGVGFVSACALRDPGPGGPVVKRLAEIPMHRSIFLVRSRRRPLLPVGRRFAEFVLAGARFAT